LECHLECRRSESAHPVLCTLRFFLVRITCGNMNFCAVTVRGAAANWVGVVRRVVACVWGLHIELRLYVFFFELWAL